MYDSTICASQNMLFISSTLLSYKIIKRWNIVLPLYDACYKTTYILWFMETCHFETENHKMNLKWTLKCSIKNYNLPTS